MTTGLVWMKNWQYNNLHLQSEIYSFKQQTTFTSMFKSFLVVTSKIKVHKKADTTSGHEKYGVFSDIGVFFFISF